MRSQLWKCRKTTIWPLETIKNVKFCLKVSPTPTLLCTPHRGPTTCQLVHLAPKHQFSLHLSGDEHKHIAGRKTSINRKAPYCSSSPRKGAGRASAEGAAPHQLDRPMSIPGDQLRPFPSFLFRQKSPGVLAPGCQRVRKRCVLLWGGEEG